MKGAVLMLAIGEEEAAAVMKHLGPRDVQKLASAMATLKSIGSEDIGGVLVDFLDKASEHTTFGQDSDEYIRAVLTNALGDDKASGMLNKILQTKDTGGLESLKWIDAETVAEIVKNEHPQVIATILVHLEFDHAASVIGYFTDRLRQDVMLRIATLDGVKPTALNELNQVLAKLLYGNENLKKQTMGGIKTAAEIMNFMSGESEAVVMEAIKTYNEEMAQEIMDEMFVFDNMIEISNPGIQTILREVQSEALIVALKGANEELREKIFSNMSSRAADMMREDLESKGPVKLSEVEAQQKVILQVVRRLADEGQISLGNKSEDAYV